VSECVIDTVPDMIQNHLTVILEPLVQQVQNSRSPLALLLQRLLIGKFLRFHLCCCLFLGGVELLHLLFKFIDIEGPGQQPFVHLVSALAKLGHQVLDLLVRLCHLLLLQLLWLFEPPLDLSLECSTLELLRHNLTSQLIYARTEVVDSEELLRRFTTLSPHNKHIVFVLLSHAAKPVV